VPGYEIPWTVIAPLAGVTALFFLFVVGMALKARKRPVITGAEELIGARGEIIERTQDQYWARVRSETWQVRSSAPLARGQHVKVIGIDGLVLLVEPEVSGPAQQ